MKIAAIKWITAAAAGGVSAWFGQIVPLIVLVLCAVALDYCTGIAASAKEGELSSSRGAKGIYKKVGLFGLLMTGFFLDYAIPVFAGRGLDIPTLPFGLIVAAWIVLNECLSVLENLTRLGVKLPPVLGRMLRTTRDKLDKE